MAPNSRCLIFIWMLSLTTSSVVTPDHTDNSKQVTTVQSVERTIFDLLTTKEATLNKVSEFSSPGTTADVNPTDGVMEKNSSTIYMPKTQMRSSEIFLAATNPTNSTKSQTSSSSAGMEPYRGQTPNATTSVMLTTMVTRPPTQGSTTQSQEVANTSLVTIDKTINVSTHQAQTTNLISSAMPSTSVDNKSETTLPRTGGVATTLTISYRSPTTTARPPIRTTVIKKVQPPPRRKSGNSPVHSKVVAGLIGGALLLMLLGFLLIYIKKQKLNKQKVTTTEWAGPSPFLEDGATNGDITMRSSNRISLSSFLPQRLSKRLSLIQESNEELQEIVPGTFGGKNQEGGGERELDKNNGTPQFVQEQTRLADAPEANGKSVSKTSQQTNNSEIV